MGNLLDKLRKKNPKNFIVRSLDEKWDKFSIKQDINDLAEAISIILLEQTSEDIPKEIKKEDGLLRDKNFIETVKEVSPIKYSVFVSFSRAWALEKWFEKFNTIQFPDASITELIFIYDTDDKQEFNKAVEKLNQWSDRFYKIQAVMTNLKKCDEFQVGNTGRRSHIVNNWKLFLKYSSGEIILGAEDDTLPDRDDAYIELIKNKEELNATFVQGIEVGRWNLKCLGSWSVIPDASGNVYTLETHDLYEGIIEIQGGGWYCFAMDKGVLDNYQFHVSINPDAGPDVMMVFDLYKMGYKCYSNFDILCTHFTENSSLHPLDDDVIVYRRSAETRFAKEVRSIRRISSNQSKINIVIPAYKSEEFVEECLDSIYSQVPRPDRVLIGVDGCPDTLRKLKEIRSKYDNLEIYYSEINNGSYITCNTLITKIPKDQYFIKFDSDDFMYPGFIAEMYRDLDNKRTTDGVIFLSKKDFDLCGGYEAWKCGADTDMVQRLKIVSSIKNAQKLFKYNKHDKQLTAKSDTSLKSKYREDIIVEIRRRMAEKYKNNLKVEKQTCKMKKI